MPKANVEAKIQARVQSFVADLTDLIRAAAMESVSEALGAGVAMAPSRGRKATKRKTKAKGRKRAGKRVRRSPEDVQALADNALAAITKNPGQGLGAIAAGLGEDVKDVRRPVQTLMEAGKVRMEGNRRSATYHPGRGGAGSKMKGSKKKVGRTVSKRGKKA